MKIFLKNCERKKVLRLLKPTNFYYKLQSKVPKEEENLENLLDQLSNDTTMNYLTKQTQKDNLLYIDPKNKSFKLGDFLLLDNKFLGQIISLRDKHTIILLTSKELIKENTIKLHEIVNRKSEFNPSLIKGKITDFTGNIISSPEEKGASSDIIDISHLLLTSNITSSLTRIFTKRNMTEDAIYSGTLIIDYACPLYKGNFHLLTGKVKTGKRTFLRNLSTNFLNEPNKALRQKHLVYVTFSRSQAINLKKQTSSENVSIFTLSENPSDAEYYYLPTIAMNYAKELIKNNSNNTENQQLDILFCLDDVPSFIFKEKKIFENIHQPFSSKNLFADLYELSGNFTKHSFTTFLVNEEKTNIEFEQDYNNYINNIISFTDLQIKFDTNIKFYKKYLPQIQVNYYQSLHMYLHSKYITNDIIRFREIMDAINFSHERFEEAYKLNIHKDPWENYLYYDSKFVIDLIFRKSYITTIENDYILLKFLLFIFNNDFVPHFKQEGKLVGNKLFEYLNNPSNQENFSKVIDYSRKLIFEKYNPKEEKYIEFENYLHELFFGFIENLKTKDEFSQFKNDYFNI